MGNEKSVSSSNQDEKDENITPFVAGALTAVAVIGAAGYITYKIVFDSEENNENFKKIECEEKKEEEEIIVQNIVKQQEDLIESEPGIPDGFMCPITHEIMKIPVILVETGHTFEKSALEKWLEKNNTCPMTGKELVSKNFVIVYSLKKAIEHWKNEKNETKVSK